MIKNRWTLLLFLPVLLLLMGARVAPLSDPDPIMVPSGLSAEQVRRDITRALISRGWTVTDERDGHIDATLNIREHTARIAIVYDPRQVRISYVSSENLKYEQHRKRGTVIHKNYLGWIQNLVRDIGVNLQLTAQG